MTAAALHHIYIVDLDEEFTGKESFSLLTGMEDQRKKAIQVGCRGGGCGICKIRIISGDFVAKKMSVKHVSEEEKQEGFALSCRVFPRSDMVIDSLHHA